MYQNKNRYILISLFAIKDTKHVLFKVPRRGLLRLSWFFSDQK